MSAPTKHAVAAIVALSLAMLSGLFSARETASVPALDASARPTRIASASPVVDQILLALVEPARIAGVTSYSAQAGWQAWRFSGLPQVQQLDDVEAWVALESDLVLVSNVSDPRRTQRLVDAGLRVVDAGAPAGLEAFYQAVEIVGAAVGEPERAARYLEEFKALERHLSADPPRGRALYVGAYGGQLYGGGAGTNQADVLRLAGLEDVAVARGVEKNPAYTLEDLLQMDPDLLVMEEGQGRPLCARLPELRACQAQAILELPSAFLSDCGPGIFSAALLLRAQLDQR